MGNAGGHRTNRLQAPSGLPHWGAREIGRRDGSARDSLWVSESPAWVYPVRKEWELLMGSNARWKSQQGRLGRSFPSGKWRTHGVWVLTAEGRDHGKWELPLGRQETWPMWENGHTKGRGISSGKHRAGWRWLVGAGAAQGLDKGELYSGVVPKAGDLARLQGWVPCVPGHQGHLLPTATTASLVEAQERPWGWPSPQPLSLPRVCPCTAAPHSPPERAQPDKRRLPAASAW